MLFLWRRHRRNNCPLNLWREPAQHTPTEPECVCRHGNLRHTPSTDVCVLSVCVSVEWDCVDRCSKGVRDSLEVDGHAQDSKRVTTDSSLSDSCTIHKGRVHLCICYLLHRLFAGVVRGHELDSRWQRSSGWTPAFPRAGVGNHAPLRVDVVHAPW